MPLIHLTNFIAAPAERVYDLSRNISLHRLSMQHTGEQAIAGVTSGLIQLNETVTWQAKHLFKNRVLKVQITQMQPYHFFEDEMLEGDFALMKHTHHFKPVVNGVIMIDLFRFETPYRLLGKMMNRIFLTRYMQQLLQQRNKVIKEYAETEKWKTVLT